MIKTAARPKAVSPEAGPGRPEGSKNPSPIEAINRKVPAMYRTLLTRALAGDVDAIRLSLEIIHTPEKFPSCGR